MSNTKNFLSIDHKRGGPYTPEKRAAAKSAFLEVYSLTNCIMDACEAAGINRNLIYLWKRNGTLTNDELWEAEETYYQRLRDRIHLHETALEYLNSRQLSYKARNHLPEFRPIKTKHTKQY